MHPSYPRNIKKHVFKQQMIILEWLKTGVMAAERSSQEIHYILKYIQTENILNCNISHCYCFYCISDQINAVLLSIRDKPNICMVVYTSI